MNVSRTNPFGAFTKTPQKATPAKRGGSTPRPSTPSNPPKASNPFGPFTRTSPSYSPTARPEPPTPKRTAALPPASERFAWLGE
jgi:hypothetical protein